MWKRRNRRIKRGRIEGNGKGIKNMTKRVIGNGGEEGIGLLVLERGDETREEERGRES